MNKYIVTIREILERQIIIKADGEQDAINKANSLVQNEDIVLDADDFSHREYCAEEEARPTRDLMCLQCGRLFIAASDDVSADDLGSHTVCPYCKGSFDIEDSLSG